MSFWAILLGFLKAIPALAGLAEKLMAWQQAQAARNREKQAEERRQVKDAAVDRAIEDALKPEDQSDQRDKKDQRDGAENGNAPSTVRRTGWVRTPGAEQQPAADKPAGFSSGGQGGPRVDPRKPADD